MMWFLGILAVLLVGLVVIAGTGRFGQLPPVVDDTPAPLLPPGDLTGADLLGVRFAVVPRGYSMEQVDQLLERLALQLGGVKGETLE